MKALPTLVAHGRHPADPRTLLPLFLVEEPWPCDGLVSSLSPLRCHDRKFSLLILPLQKNVGRQKDVM